MQALSKRAHRRLLTDIAFAATLTATAAFSLAAAQAQTSPSQQQPSEGKKGTDNPGELQDNNKNAPIATPNAGSQTIGETRAAPAPSLPSQQDRPPVSAAPLDQPDKALHSAPPEKIESK